MENNSLTDIVKSRREAGEGVFSSIGGAAKERLKEKFDIRRALPQGGLLTALFPKLKAYKAQQLNPQSGESAGVGATPVGSDSLATTKPLIDSLSINTKIIAKNSMALPLIQKDSNLIAKTLRRIIRVMQIRRKVNPFAKKTTAILSKSYSAGETSGQLEAEREEPKKEKNPIEKLLESIKETFSNLKSSITKTLTELPGKIIKGIVDGMKGLFTITKFASAFLLSLLKPLLGLIFSPVGFALLLAAGIFFSLYQLSKDYIKGKKISDELKSLIEKENEGTLTDSEKERLRVLRLAQQSGQPGAVAGSKEQINLSLKQTMQPQVAEFIKKGLESNDPEDKTLAIEELKKFGLIGEKGIEVFNKYYQIMFTGNKKQNIIDFIEKNKQYGITNATLGSVAASMNYVQELVPQQKVKANQANDTLLSSNIDADDAAAGAGMREMSSTPTNVINLPNNDGPGTTSTAPSVMIGARDTMNSAQDGPGTTSTVSSIPPASPAGDISVALTSGLQNDGPGPAIPITGSKTVPAAAYNKDEALDIIIKNIMEAQNPMNSANQDGPANSNESASQSGRLGSTLNGSHPVVISHHNAMAMALQISQTG
jgi:hypothetical protein